jgi:DinB superfamily
MTQQNDIVQQLTGVLRQQGSRPLNELDALMANTAADWQRCLQAMTEAQACFHPSEGPDVAKPWSGEGDKWSPKEVIGHYLLSHRSLNQRIAETAGLPPPAVEVPRVQAMGEQSAEDERQPIDELRRRLDGFFEDTRALLSSLESKGVPEGVLSFPHPVFGPLTVTEWIAFHWLHTMDHVGQITALKSAPGYPAV